MAAAQGALSAQLRLGTAPPLVAAAVSAVVGLWSPLLLRSTWHLLLHHRIMRLCTLNVAAALRSCLPGV